MDLNMNVVHMLKRVEDDHKESNDRPYWTNGGMHGTVCAHRHAIKRLVRHVPYQHRLTVLR